MALEPKFLEWMGQMLLLSAKNMEQANKFMSWFKEGFPEGKEWEEWLEPYLQLLPRGAERGTEELRSYFQEFFQNLGIVSRKEYLELEQKYQELKEELEKLNKKVEAKRAGLDLMNQWVELINYFNEANKRFLEEWNKLLLMQPTKKVERKNE